MISQEPKEKQGEVKVFPGSAPHRHEPFQMLANTNSDKQPKSKVELDSLLDWEGEGGQINKPCG
jgi:hypothetical protein